ALLVGALILSIYIHELGHAFACRSLGVAVHEVAIHGGGGYCRHDGAGPPQEMLIVAAGPLASLALAVAAWLAEAWALDVARGAGGDAATLWWLKTAARLGFLGEMNVVLCLLNLMPVLPLDGGRLLLLGLWRNLPYDRAMRFTGLVGVAVAALWLPAAFLLFQSYGFVLLFFPSIRDNWLRFLGRTNG
ncbi:MAG: M50 family metallopeptidase, partial [Pseudomonadota bacterium]